MIVRAVGAIWVNPFAMVLFTVCSAVTSVVLYPFCVGVLVCLRLCMEECSSPMSEITERGDMGLYKVPLSLLGFGMGTMLANFYVWYYVGVKSSFSTCS